MHDHKRLRPSTLIFLGLALALVPACDEGEPSVTDLEFRTEQCPWSWTLYGESVGGFCCSGSTDGYSCDGTVCALDPNQSQGNRMCSSYECPLGWELYGEWAGGFCCNGTTDGDSCDGGMCALDPAQSQGLFECVDEMSDCPVGKVYWSVSGLCCDNDGEGCQVPNCPMDANGQTDGYQVCYAEDFDMPFVLGRTECEFIEVANPASSLKLTVPAYWQTHTSSVLVNNCGDAQGEKLFVYDGYGQTSDTNVFDVGEKGNLYPWIQYDARSMWISPTHKHVCFVHQDSDEYRTCVPPSNEVLNLAPDFGDQVERIEASPNWLFIGASLFEHPYGNGQWVYISANEDLRWRPILTNGGWTSWDHAVSSFKIHSF